ncbi:MAG: T9SS type A sorting domain-containing protein [Crocinitomicaceae bacterium]|nr:T9SS type A sorting domain-containing protein [Crocinitomicaceae bacterium]
MIKYLLTVSVLFAFMSSSAQNCSLNFSVDSTSFCQSYVSNSETICQGDTFCLTANATLSTIGQAFDFNINALPLGWYMSGTPNFGSPCLPSLSGTNYYWSSAATGPNYPHVSTASTDVSCGGTINFEMVMGVQGLAAPCDGPDQVGESIHLRYSNDGGMVWIDIEVYTPDLVTNAYTTWECYSVPIPPGAMTTYTMFHWQQDITPSANFDNWGLDNIVVDLNCNQPVINWSTGTLNSTAICDNPTSNQSYIAYVYDGLSNLQCQDTFDVIVTPSYNLSDSITICENEDYTFPDGSTVTGITSPMNQTSYLITMIGCDSTIVTSIDVHVPDVSVTQNDSLLTAVYGLADSYVWLDCDNNYQVVPWPNSQSFIASQSGSYAVQLNTSGCIDTSACSFVGFAGLEEFTSNDFEIYPNPSSGKIEIRLTESAIGEHQTFIYSTAGKLILEDSFFGNTSVINMQGIDKGIYLVVVQLNDTLLHKRLILE